MGTMSAATHAAAARRPMTVGHVACCDREIGRMGQMSRMSLGSSRHGGKYIFIAFELTH
jgi:hypothetical protein